MLPQTWSDFERVERSTKRSDDTGPLMLELPESGWGALVAWAAGPAHAFMRLDVGPVPPVKIEVNKKGRQTQRYQRSRTPADQVDIDDAIDAFLADAGVSPRPRGYRWFIRLPDAQPNANSFWTFINTRLAEGAADERHPSKTYAVLRGILAEAYGFGT